MFTRLKKSRFIMCLGLMILLLYPTSSLFANAPFILRAHDSWVNSGVTVTDGEVVHVRATGHVITGSLVQFPGARSNADGQVTDCTMFDGVSPCALDGAPYGAVIGKIGLTGEAFLIGSDMTFTADGSGTLYLNINDNLPYYYDNIGIFVVRIR